MDVVRVDRPAPNVVRLLINRPDKRNAIDFDVRQALIDQIITARANPENRALVFGGVGGTFSAGGDIASMASLDEAGARERMRHIHALCRLVAGCGLPVVTAVEGHGVGAGLGLALLGDVIVVGHGSKLLFPFLRLGLAPDWGLLHTLPLRVGLGVARRVLTQGKTLSGPEAVELGLADELVDDARVMPRAVEQASKLAQLPREALARMKARLTAPVATLEEELVREERDQAALLQGEDFGEGYAAFVAKRDPRFIR